MELKKDPTDQTLRETNGDWKRKDGAPKKVRFDHLRRNGKKGETATTRETTLLRPTRKWERANEKTGLKGYDLLQKAKTGKEPFAQVRAVGPVSHTKRKSVEQPVDIQQRRPTRKRREREGKLLGVQGSQGETMRRGGSENYIKLCKSRGGIALKGRGERSELDMRK